jgi:hypothetical protein
MSAADERITELLDRWLASVDLHIRYLQLDDAAYARVQDWPSHQRPAKWLVELAQKRLLELKRELVDRQGRGDAGFAESLELMSFLTTLLGSEHIERFIPLAKSRAAAEMPAAPATSGAPAQPGAPAEPAAAGTARRRAAPRQDVAPPEPATTIPDHLAQTVIADAVRFLSWGREWPQLAGLIARLADRPPEQEIWPILRRHRAAIEAQAKRPPD